MSVAEEWLAIQKISIPRKKENIMATEGVRDSRGAVELKDV